MKQEFSGSFEMINDEIEQEFQASANGTGKFASYLCLIFFVFKIKNNNLFFLVKIENFAPKSKQDQEDK